MITGEQKKWNEYYRRTRMLINVPDEYITQEMCDDYYNYTKEKFPNSIFHNAEYVMQNAYIAVMYIVLLL